MGVEDMIEGGTDAMVIGTAAGRVDIVNGVFVDVDVVIVAIVAVGSASPPTTPLRPVLPLPVFPHHQHAVECML